MLFKATGMGIDEFVDLVGCSGISEGNISQFLGCFELIADKLISENGGVIDNDQDIDLLASIRKNETIDAVEPVFQSDAEEDEMR